VVVAVGGRHRQAVLQQLDAVLVIVGRIEVRAAARHEQLVRAADAVGPHPRHVSQHVGHAIDLPAGEVAAINNGDPAGREGALRFDLGLDLRLGDDDVLGERGHFESKIGYGRA